MENLPGQGLPESGYITKLNHLVHLQEGPTVVGLTFVGGEAAAIGDRLRSHGRIPPIAAVGKSLCPSNVDGLFSMLRRRSPNDSKP